MKDAERKELLSVLFFSRSSRIQRFHLPSSAVPSFPSVAFAFARSPGVLFSLAAFPLVRDVKNVSD